MAGPGSYLLGKEEKEAILKVIESGSLFRYGSLSDPKFGAEVWNFEQEVAKYLKTAYVLTVNSGTSALWVALSALGIGPGDEVIVPGYTFIASITSVIFARAIPVLAEIDESLTLDPKDVEAKITPRTRAIMLVHMLGNPGYIDEIKIIADKHNLLFIEDTAQAFGAKYKGKFAGTYGHFGTYSFNVFKTITAGDGGAVSTENQELFKKAFAVHDQGHMPLRQGVEVGARTVLGLDFRMTELAAAVLRAQLRKTEFIKSELKQKKQRFKDGIKDIKGMTFRKLPDPDGALATLLTVLFPTEEIARKIGADIQSGVVANSGWHVYNNMEHILAKLTVDKVGCPYSCPYYTNKGGKMEYSKGMLPKTDGILSRAINIGIGVSDAGLGAGFGINILSSNDEIDQKIEIFRKTAQKYLK
jgi:dTDP-4-amino-4,6-dideoxygalactose transaminase